MVQRTGYSLGDVLKGRADLSDSLLRGGPIQSVGELVEKGYNLAVTCLGCGHRGVISGVRFYFHCRSRGSRDSFELFQRKLRCSVCGASRIITRATTDAAEDALPEPDWSHPCMSDKSIRQGC